MIIETIIGYSTSTIFDITIIICSQCREACDANGFRMPNGDVEGAVFVFQTGGDVQIIKLWV